MENKLLSMIRRYDMVTPGDTVICAVSGGADSMALLWGMWLLREKLGITLEAAHFNHHLRMEESDRDEAFVRDFCDFHDIPLHLGGGEITAGKKGLEAAARDARYAFLRSLDGTIATAHTADDNAETVLMHLIRGTGLRGLGGITPKGNGLIRPMLEVTRPEVEEFLAFNGISHVEDSSNGTDAFLRNRIRHRVMPLLKAENPSLCENLSAMAQRLRQDEELLENYGKTLDYTDVSALKDAPAPLRRRALEGLLKDSGLPEPNAAHIARAEALVFADRPSAFGEFPGGVVLRRNYERLEAGKVEVPLEPVILTQGQTVVLSNGMAVTCTPATDRVDTPDCFTVSPVGKLVIRGRRSGDTLTRPGGTKSLKKRFIDRKIPAHLRDSVPVVADDLGILGVCGFGCDIRRDQSEPLVQIKFVTLS